VAPEAGPAGHAEIDRPAIGPGPNLTLACFPGPADRR